MPFSMNNLLASGNRALGGAADTLDAAVGASSRMWNGFQPFGWLAGRYHYQGTLGGRWRANDWKITAIGGAGTTLVPADGTPPTATFITRATADGDGYNLQWSMDGGTTIQEVFKPTAGLNIYFECKMKLDNAADDAHTKGRFYVGISDVDTDLHGSVSNFIGFYKASGAATFAGVLDASSQTLTTSTGTIANDTYITLGFRVNGVSSVDFFVNGVLLEHQTTVTNLPSTDMCLTIQGETSEAAAITYSFQNIVCWQESF